jgi:hypothetical protein
MTEYIIVKIDEQYLLVQRLGLDKSQGLGKLDISQLKTLVRFEDKEDMLDFLYQMNILYKDSVK